jgi:hypothetical protein
VARETIDLVMISPLLEAGQAHERPAVSTIAAKVFQGPGEIAAPLVPRSGC